MGGGEEPGKGSKVQRLISRDPEDIGTHTQTHKKTT